MRWHIARSDALGEGGEAAAVAVEIEHRGASLVPEFLVEVPQREDLRGFAGVDRGRRLCAFETLPLDTNIAPREAGQHGGSRYVRRSTALAELRGRYLNVAHLRQIAELLPRDATTKQHVNGRLQPPAGRNQNLAFIRIRHE